MSIRDLWMALTVTREGHRAPWFVEPPLLDPAYAGGLGGTLAGPTDYRFAGQQTVA